MEIKQNKTFSSAYKNLITFEAFMATVSAVLMGDQPCENGISIQCSGDYFYSYFHHHSDVDVMIDTSFIFCIYKGCSGSNFQRAANKTSNKRKNGIFYKQLCTYLSCFSM
jgi:hypothetical protein